MTQRVFCPVLAPGVTESPLTFPCDFPIKVIADARPGLEDEVRALLQPLLPGLDAAALRRTPSAAGRFLSITVTVRAESREQLDALYRALHASGRFRMVL